MGLKVQTFHHVFFKWLKFILKYGEDDYVKYKNINEKTFLEKTALSRKN
jgi:hypothetical protein